MPRQVASLPGWFVFALRALGIRLTAPAGLRAPGGEIVTETLLFLPPALRTDSDLRLARSTFTKPDFKIVAIYNDDNAMASH